MAPTADPGPSIKVATFLIRDRFGNFPEYESWSWPGGLPILWFGGRDVLIREDMRTWLWVRMRTSTAIDEVRQALPGGWSASESR
jgi:hypothetical protein